MSNTNVCFLFKRELKKRERALLSVYFVTERIGKILPDLYFTTKRARGLLRSRSSFLGAVGELERLKVK